MLEQLGLQYHDHRSTVHSIVGSLSQGRAIFIQISRAVDALGLIVFVQASIVLRFMSVAEWMFAIRC